MLVAGNKASVGQNHLRVGQAAGPYKLQGIWPDVELRYLCSQVHLQVLCSLPVGQGVKRDGLNRAWLDLTHAPWVNLQLSKATLARQTC